MGQTCQDDTRTELSRPGEPDLTTRMVEKDIQQQHARKKDYDMRMGHSEYSVGYAKSID